LISYLGSSKGKNTFGRKFALGLGHVHILGEGVAAREVSRDKALAVALFLVLALNGDGVLAGGHGHLLGLELLHVQLDGEGVGVGGDVLHDGARPHLTIVV